MSWRDILVHVKACEDWSEHIDVAMRLAKDFNAKLAGLYTCRDVAVLKILLGEDAATAQEIEQRELAHIQAAEQRFKSKLKENGVSGDWDHGEGAASDLVTLAARVHDIAIVEQTDETSDEPGWDVAETCAVSSGTPTLVIPCKGSFPVIGKRILLAWNGSRQAATAMHAALPLISRAEHVTVLLGRGKDSFGSITRYPRLDVAGYLSRHAAEVSSRVFETSDFEAGARILQLAGDTNSDLIVMGAYGHSSWRELFLGGATRYVLKHMSIPVLMAH
jgi:nucleotide-binding universal stress UspA family protein